MVDETIKHQIWAEADALSTTDDLGIWAYGAEVQNALNDFSKEMAWSIGNNGSGLSVDVFNELISEIDETERRNSSFLSNFYSNDTRSRNYRNLLKYINKAVIRLQLNQANLIKDLSVLQKMEIQVVDCQEKLSCYEEAGQARLEAIGSEFLLHNEGNEQAGEIQEWCVRFEKRLQTIELSKTIALQNIAQIKLLIQSDKKLIDQLGECISITIPTWRTQISICMGIENVADSVKAISKTIKRSVQKKNRIQKIDLEKAHKNDIALKIAVQSLIKAAGELSDESRKENELLRRLGDA